MRKMAMTSDGNERDTFDVLMETVQEIRADEFPQISPSLVKAIIDAEIRHEENPELAVPEIEQAVSKAAKGKIGEGRG